MACAIFHISGHVQGVSFRAGTRAQALRLRISGHARNLRDGRVEVVAQGDSEALATLEHWLQHGPIGARVDAVEREDVPQQALSGFYTR
ncbi:MAG: acylphosphatase [Dokdonella sp.]